MRTEQGVEGSGRHGACWWPAFRSLPPACRALLLTHIRVYVLVLPARSAMHQAWCGPPRIPVQREATAGPWPGSRRAHGRGAWMVHDGVLHCAITQQDQRGRAGQWTRHRTREPTPSKVKSRLGGRETSGTLTRH